MTGDWKHTRPSCTACGFPRLLRCPDGNTADEINEWVQHENISHYVSIQFSPINMHASITPDGGGHLVSLDFRNAYAPPQQHRRNPVRYSLMQKWKRNCTENMCKRKFTMSFSDMRPWITLPLRWASHPDPGWSGSASNCGFLFVHTGSYLGWNALRCNVGLRMWYTESNYAVSEKKRKSKYCNSASLWLVSNVSSKD